MADTLYIFSKARFSNFANVFTKSLKYESALYAEDLDTPFDRYSAPDIGVQWSLTAGIIRYCLAFQFNRSTIVTVVTDVPLEEIDSSLTALGLVEDIDFVTLIDDDSTEEGIILNGFQSIFRGHELLSDYDVIGQQEIDFLNDKFNSIYKYMPTF